MAGEVLRTTNMTPETLAEWDEELERIGFDPETNSCTANNQNLEPDCGPDFGGPQP